MGRAPDQNEQAMSGKLPDDPGKGVRKANLQVVRGAIDAVEAAERGLLAALLWAGSNAPDALRVSSVQDILENSEPFRSHDLGEVYKAILACASAKSEHDPIAVFTECSKAGIARSLTLDVLEKLKAEASTVSEKQARVYAKTIRQGWARRGAIEAARQLQADAADPSIEADALMEKAREATRVMSERSSSAARSVSLKESAALLFNELKDGTSKAIPTGLQTLDQALNGGLRPGEVSVLAARTNVGKSVLAAQIGEHMVTHDPSAGVLYVTLEMAHKSFTARLVAARSGVPLSNLRRLILNPTQWSDVTRTVKELAEKGLYFADNPTQTMAAIYATALERQRLLTREGKRLVLVVIDHIGLVKPSSESLKRSNREQQVAETSRAQRVIAGELGVHVLGIAQILRESEKQGPRSMPKLAHLRESGSLEQDADTILILHRERDPQSGMFDLEMPPALAVAKGRLDETAVMLLQYEAQRAHFSDWNGTESFHDYYGSKKKTEAVRR